MMRRFIEQQQRFFEAINAQGNRLLLLDERNEAVRGVWSRGASRQGYAAFLASGGRFKTIALDFDGKMAGPDAAIADAEFTMNLLSLGGISAVMCASGSAGGRHVIFTVQPPGLSARRTWELVHRLGNLGLASLDRSNLSNVATGAIRPPMAPRRFGYGRSRILGPSGVALRVLEAGNPPEAVSRFVEEIAGPSDRRPRLRGPDAEGDAGGAPPGSGSYRTGSEALMGLATHVANRRLREVDLHAAIDALSADDPVRLHLRRQGPDAPRAVRRAWDKAVLVVAERPAVAAAFVDDGEVLRQWRAVDVSRLPGAQGRVALVALCLAERERRRLIGLPVRWVAEQAGLAKSSAGRALQALVKSNVVEVAGVDRGPRGVRYRLVPVDLWSEDARGTVGIPSSWGGVGRPPVPRASPGLALADDLRAEVWSDEGLGEPARRLYRALVLATSESGGARVADLALEVDRQPRTVARTLTMLKTAGLARASGRGCWVAEVRDPIDLAFDLGVVGTNAARVARHQAERRRDAQRRIAHRLALRGVDPVRQTAYNRTSRWARGEEDLGCAPFTAADPGVSGGH